MGTFLEELKKQIEHEENLKREAQGIEGAKLTSIHFINAFGSVTKAHQAIGCSRRAIYDFIEKGEISGKPARGPAGGVIWREIIKDLADKPENKKRRAAILALIK
jgi:hypothetical protein